MLFSQIICEIPGTPATMSFSDIIPIILFLLYIIHVCSHCSGHELQDVIDLKQLLFNGTDYDTSIRPIMNQSQNLQVLVSLSFSAIVNFTVTSGTLRMLSLLVLTWKDEQLTWNSSDFGGLNRISLDSDVLWTPTLIQLTDVGYEFPVSPTWVYATGDVLLMRAGELSGFCKIDMTYFPYDSHDCNFDLIPVVHSSEELSLTCLADKVNLESYINSGQWDILDTQSYVITTKDQETNVSTFYYANKVKVRRKPQFLILHVVIPMALILILNTFVYIVPVDSGERISISVTLLLTMVFFTTDLSDTIPESSDNISLLSMIMVAVNSSSALSVAVSVVLCKIVSQSNKPIPKALAWITQICRRRSKVAPMKGTLKDTISKRKPNEATREVQTKGQRLSILNEIEECEDIEGDERVFHNKKLKDVSWMDVAKCIDFILCSVTLLFVLVVCSGFIGVLVNVHLKSFKY